MIASEDRNQIHPRNRQLKEIRRERERRREGGDHRFGLGVQEAAAAREFFCSPSLPPSLTPTSYHVEYARPKSGAPVWPLFENGLRDTFDAP